jgi:hypothetical protein
LHVWGEALIQNVVVGVQNRIDIENFVIKVVLRFFPLYLPLVAAVAILVYRILVRRQLAAGLRPLVMFAVAWMALSLLAALKRGSAEHYLNEFLVFATLAVAALIGRRPLGGAEEHPLVPVAQLWLVLLTGILLYTNVLHYVAVFGGRWFPGARPLVDYRQRVPVAAALRPALVENDTYVATRDKALANLLAPRALTPHWEVTEQVFEDGLLPRNILDRVRTSDSVEFVVVREDDPWPQIVDDRREDYRADRTINQFTIYRLRRNEPIHD